VKSRFADWAFWPLRVQNELLKLWIFLDILVGLLEGGLAHLMVSTYTEQHNTEERGQSYMPREGFESTVLVFERSKTIRSWERRRAILWGRNLVTVDVFGGEETKIWSTLQVNGHLCKTRSSRNKLRRPLSFRCMNLRRCIQKFPDWVENEINNSSNNNKHSLRSNTKGYGDKTN
jgi:hypothetical protein